MFCEKRANQLISRVHNGALKALYNDFDSRYTELLRKVIIKLYTILIYRNLSQKISLTFWKIFLSKKHSLNYNLRISNLLELPKQCSTITYGLQTFRYRGSATWNTLPDDINESGSISMLKKKLKDITIKFSCKSCLNS